LLRVLVREDQITRLRNDLADLKKQFLDDKDVKKGKIEELTRKQQENESQQRQQAENNSRAISSMQRKLFEAQQANQDAFHARETLVHPDEQLDNNDRDMIDSLVKNPGIGALVLGCVLFVSGVQLSSKVKPDDEFKDDNDPEKSDDGGGGGGESSGSGSCDFGVPSYISAPFKWVSDKFSRLMAAFSPTIMLLIQFSYIYFIFNEAYESYTGGVCPAYDAQDGRYGSFVPQPDGTTPRIRILMGFIGVYFTARTLSQMFVFLKALNERTVSNKDKATKTWTQKQWDRIVYVFKSCCKCCTAKRGSGQTTPDTTTKPAKPSSKELKISRVKGHICSKPKCSHQGFYYLSKETDVVNQILARMVSVPPKTEAKVMKAEQDPKGGKDDGQDGKPKLQDIMKKKALMEFGLPMFLGPETFTVILDGGKLQVPIRNAPPLSRALPRTHVGPAPRLGQLDHSSSSTSFLSLCIYIYIYIYIYIIGI
jgi:hypothetical protein